MTLFKFEQCWEFRYLLLRDGIVDEPPGVRPRILERGARDRLRFSEVLPILGTNIDVPLIS